MQNQNNDSKIPWLLGQFEKRIHNYKMLSLKIMEKTEYVRWILQEMLIEYTTKHYYTNRQDVYNMVRNIQDQLYSF